ncbi:unnamed protein product [Amaranthus hypochondriacus]
MAQDGQNGAATAVVFSAFKPQVLVQAPKAVDAVQFYKSAFGAEEVGREVHPKRKADQELPQVISADLKLGSSVFSVSDLPSDAAEVKSEGSGILFCLETEDVSGAISKAVAAGAVAEGDVTKDEVTGTVGKVKDPYGYLWVISSPAVVKPAESEA